MTVVFWGVKSWPGTNVLRFQRILLHPLLPSICLHSNERDNFTILISEGVQKTLMSFVQKTAPLHTCLCNLLHLHSTSTLKMEIIADKTTQHANPEDHTIHFLCDIHFCFYICDTWKLAFSYPHITIQ